jgi:hypothetical protein
MPKFIRRRVLLVASALSGLLATPFFVASGVAEPKSMTIPLTGAAEVPPVPTPAKGSAALAFDPATRNLAWIVEFSDLSGPATMAHFHGPALPGKNAPPILWIVEKGAAPVSPVKGSATLTPDQAKEFTSGAWYLNVHTPNNPSGEIRGQIPALN